MLDGVNLISRKESKILYEKQYELLNEFSQTKNTDFLLRVALLQTLIPICDNNVALQIMEMNMTDKFDFLIIGSYISSQTPECVDNVFLSRLMVLFSTLNDYQKSVANYLCALQNYNKTTNNSHEILKFLNQSIALYDDYSAHYYLRYLMLQDITDFYSAKRKVEKIVTAEQTALLTVDDLIDPQNFIDEHILKRTITTSAFDALFSANT